MSYEQVVDPPGSGDSAPVRLRVSTRRPMCQLPFAHDNNQLSHNGNGRLPQPTPPAATVVGA